MTPGFTAGHRIEPEPDPHVATLAMFTIPGQIAFDLVVVGSAEACGGASDGDKGSEGVAAGYGVVDDSRHGQVHLGGFRAASDVMALRKAGITHVLCMDKDVCHPDEVESYLVEAGGADALRVIGLTHAADEDITAVLDDAHGFIDGARASGGRVLVHCLRGVNRSGAIVVSYVMRALGLGYDDALARVRACRPSVQPDETDMAADEVTAATEVVRVAAAEHPRNFTHRCRAIVTALKASRGGTWLATATRRKMTSRFQYTKGTMLFFNLDGVNYQLYQAPPVTMERPASRTPPRLPLDRIAGVAGLDIRKTTLPETETTHIVSLALEMATSVSSDAAHNFRDALHQFYGAPWHVYLSSSANPAFVFGCYVVHDGHYLHVNLPGALDLYAFKSTTGASSLLGARPLELQSGRGSGGGAGAGGSWCSRSRLRWVGPLSVWIAFVAFVFVFAVLPAAYPTMTGSGFTTFQGPWLCTRCSQKFTDCSLFALTSMGALDEQHCLEHLPHLAKRDHVSADVRVCFGDAAAFNGETSYCEEVTRGFWVVFGVGLGFVVVNIAAMLALAYWRWVRPKSARRKAVHSRAYPPLLVQNAA
ncbi:uncharacterized protein AMSG_11932 [Thecamonas trahens ATCC 50062]|uniref:protein-tyrosine-phosphatase n=1 Tax=Thecamonas trahens ATCC 50062 TaxID=461836 RepID=A0A0L0DCD3_THETB|nr:hypothetical protein AMSG_11932 [Thecamonas trahens ATCC 50062]KNC49746.1 hypothetical protein AMSG_11932 [Thecamonas trahens ATCC 50062]|eukprot:XP_013757612.1 hypothetical protein AMSG_11932 [Thecamonas trahens ATCC 50062]